MLPMLRMVYMTALIWYIIWRGGVLEALVIDLHQLFVVNKRLVPLLGHPSEDSLTPGGGGGRRTV